MAEHLLVELAGPWASATHAELAALPRAMRLAALAQLGR